MVLISIIGSAGRKSDGNKISKSLFEKVMNNTIKLIEKIKEDNKTDDITLVSGGAAFIDHVAVRLYLDQVLKCKLILYLPCKFKDNKGEGKVGETMNYYHERFTKKIKSDSLEEISLAIKRGAVVGCDEGTEGGFHYRNGFVAKSDYIIAYTFNNGKDNPKDGGTLDTWNKALAFGNTTHRIHTSLYTL